MSGKSVPPEKIAEAITLRAAGYTALAIADRIGVSLRTVNRIFEHHKAKKGTVTKELIEAARQTLVDGVTSIDRIKEEAARLIADDLAHARLLRARMAVASEHMTATNLSETVLLMRAAAACSTALKNTSDMLRHSLGTEKALSSVEAESLPELVIMEISDADALKMSKEHVGHMDHGKRASGAPKDEGDGLDDDGADETGTA